MDMKKVSLVKLFETFVEMCEFTLRRRPATLKAYRDTFRMFNKLMPEVTQPYHLNTTRLNEFFKILQTRQRVVGRDTIQTGVKDSTIATYWSKLNTFFVWLETHGHVDRNPLYKISKPKEIYDNRPALKKQEIEKLYSCVLLNSHNTFLLKRDRAIISTLFFSGVRKSELIALQVRDVDLERKILTVRGATSKSKRTRQIPINPTLQIHLRDYLEQRKSLTSEMLFVSSNQDSGITAHGLKHWVTRLREASGVKFHLHQFRHTFACNLAKNNISLPNLQRLMGHIDLRMTERYVRSLGVEHLIDDILKLSIDDSY